MSGPTRRGVLALAGLGAATTIAAGCTTGPPGRPSESGSAMETLRQPEVLSSEDGLLDVDLRAAWGAALADGTGRLAGYNEGVPGPTLHLRPGDTLRLRLANQLGEPTNLHVHGLHVSPEGNSDNPFRVVEDGEVADYEIPLPDDHPAGTFWYHPHLHGSVADQLYAGLYGVIVIAGEDEPPSDRDRVLVISDVTLDSDGSPAGVSQMDRMMGREGELVLVNGGQRPRIAIPDGTTERWRVVNACTSRFLDLQLDGTTLTVMGRDGIAIPAHDVASVPLPPGGRVDLLVRSAGNTVLRTRQVDRGGMGMMMGGETTSPETVLADVDSAGSGTVDVGGWTPRVEDLRDSSPVRQRELTFTMEMRGGMMGGGMGFGFDGVPFDAERTDQEVALGDVEEWVIRNPTPMDHPFHLHVWHMQVVAGPGSEGDVPVWRDVVNVPAGDEVTVRIAFRDFPGRTVYHCHILDHEDLGMMGVVEAR